MPASITEELVICVFVIIILILVIAAIYIRADELLVKLGKIKDEMMIQLHDLKSAALERKSARV